MYRLLIALPLTLLTYSGPADAAGPKPKPPVAAAPMSEQAQSSYALGLDAGLQLKSLGVEINLDALLAGMKDALTGATARLTETERGKALDAVQQRVYAVQQARVAQITERNQTQGAAFLKANGAKPGVVTLSSGLQYEIITAGTGAKPGPADSVTCDYRGALIDGTEFDSSYARGRPATFRIQGLIKGWAEALPLMPVGSKWRLVVPADLAYGAKGSGDKIGPMAVLVFEIELRSIQAG